MRSLPRKFTRTAFVKYVKGHKRTSIVGFANSCTKCPLANFLNKDKWQWWLQGCSQVYVTNRDAYVVDYAHNNQIVSIKLPKWACKFVRAVDKDCHSITRRLNKAEVLALLIS